MTDIREWLREQLKLVGFEVAMCEKHQQCDHGLPDIVWADIAAKLAILELHPPANDPDQPSYCETCRYVQDPDDTEPFPDAGYPCPTVRALAAPFADRPGFLDEWRVT